MQRKLKMLCTALLATVYISSCAVPVVLADGDIALSVQEAAPEPTANVQSNTVIIEFDGVGSTTDPITDIQHVETEVTDSPAPAGQDSVHHVTFYDWYGRAMGSTDVRHGDGILKPSDTPSVSGYEFQFWFDETSEIVIPYIFGSPVTRSMNLIPYFTVAGQGSGGGQVPGESVLQHNGGQSTALESASQSMTQELLPNMPQLPQSQEPVTPALDNPDAAKKQANYFIDEMVRAMEPVESASAAAAEAERIAQSITQNLPTPEPTPVPIPIPAPVTPAPVSNEETMGLFEEIAQAGSNPAAATPAPLPTEDVSLLEPIVTAEPAPTDISSPDSSQPNLTIEDLAGEQPTQAPAETPEATEAPAFEMPTPEPIVPAQPEEALPTPELPGTPPAPTSTPKPLEDLLAITQPTPTPPMNDQDALALVNEILSQMQIETSTIADEQAVEIVELIENDQAEEAADIVEQIFEQATPTAPPPAESETAQPQPDPSVTMAPPEDPYVVATYHYDGQLASGTPVTVTANVYNIPEGQTLAFQWQCDRTGAFEDVPGATGQSHTFIVDENGLNSSSWRVNVMLEN